MQDHPLTPMRDPNLRRVLSRQTPHKVGFVPLATVDRAPKPCAPISRGCAERVAVTQFSTR
jgi:uncharacterized protein YgbK (DUF1537 family)